MMQQSQKPGPPSQRRLSFVAIGIAILCLGAIPWILSDMGLILGSWTSVFSSIFTVAGLIIALLQFPTTTFHLPAAAHITSQAHHQQQNHRLVSAGILPTLSQNEGAIVVYAKKFQLGSYMNMCPGFVSSDTPPDKAACVTRRRAYGRTYYVAAFSPLPPGNYTVYSQSTVQVARVTVSAGRIEEVDWRW